MSLRSLAMPSRPRVAMLGEIWRAYFLAFLLGLERISVTDSRDMLATGEREEQGSCWELCAESLDRKE